MRNLEADSVLNNATMAMPRLWIGAALVMLLSGCTSEPDTPAGWRVAFEDLKTGRIGACYLDGSHFKYLTPDSLWASQPVADSAGQTVYFCSSRKDERDLPNALYAVETDGTYLRKITDLPFRAIDLQVTRDGGRLVFVGSYPDQEYPRAFQLVIGEDGFTAVTDTRRAAYDICVSPGGMNFVYHDSTLSDTLYVSELYQNLTLPIMPFPYTQVSISPNGFEFAAVCGPRRRGLCHLLLKDSEGKATRDERVLVPESPDKSISHPIFNLDGRRVCYVETSNRDDSSSVIKVIDVNSLVVNEIDTGKRRVSHPAWVR